MEESPRGYTTGSLYSGDGTTTQPHTPHLGLTEAELYKRSIPDVPEDVDYYMEHLNDPNFDLKANRPGSISSTSYSMETKKKYPGWDQSDTESQFDRYSSTRAESRHSAVIEFDEESPYPEVRASVSSVDDPLMPVNTFRMWFLGLFFVFVITFFNQIFAMRYPSVYVTGIVVQLIALPCGKGLERILPKTVFNFFGYKWSLNPGPFSIKEHVCITVMANAVSWGIYITEVSLSQRVFYGVEVPYSFQILIALGSHIFGFSLAGFLRRFVVYPSSMIWPGALVNSALFNTLHKNYGVRDKGHMSRERFFLIATAASFVWYWVPGYLFTGLSMFSWICWIVPENVTVNALFGVNTGLGMSVLTFDWSMIAFVGSPLVTPWWSEMNTAVAFIVVFWIICPIIYFTNTWETSFFPISDYYSFDNTGGLYDATAILTDGVFDQAKYSAYSPVFMSSSLALAYGVAFAAFPAIFVHTFLWFRKDILRRFRSSLKDERDVHSRLMQYYPEVPGWWYAVVGVISFVFMVIALEVNPASQLPIWGLFLACGIGMILALPLAMLQAITNQSIPTQVMAELIIGYILPGRPMANMVFKGIMFSTGQQAVQFAGDLKLGHYMKIPPRLMFTLQMVAATISCFLVTGMQTWMLTHIPDVCTPQQKDGFSPGAMYSGLLWFFLIGFVLPIPCYFLARRYPLSFWRYINIPVAFAGLGAMPPASGINYISWALVGFIFNYVIRKYHFRWWMRYNYILSAALDAGVAFAMIVIFFTLSMPKGGIELNWWGMILLLYSVWQNTADAFGASLKVIGEGEIIGPSSWS
ncbi:hypothetical protein CC1G_10984 [Coprinopsis cinerea okayama7|uniref:OPT oligopeptide transporter n=1 Tax=Coprinopsis cinerea (strain Okayama-7 / 130 / ATCC MYA-4618 / FGSC 9003) TaxID=240176 RepID=A8PC37_COPC7|nr:hypothetical protein CC1G_10984 [Coprinopsis cinerea okayama7\|eukprot:XP_001840321.2 hypothetical protein CC1G_10984 [Coprinopsis cinerea okayama7\